MSYDRRTVLSAMAGGTVLAVTGFSAEVASAHERVRTGSAASAETVSRNLDQGLPTTLEGAVTTAPVSSGDQLLVGTDRGLYAFVDGGLETFVPTQPVRSIAPLRNDRAIAIVEDPAFPNVLAIDLGAGEIAWSASRTRTVSSQEFGEIERQVPAFDAVETGGTVAVATGYGIVAFEGETGERRWTVEREYYTWRVAALGDAVYASTQDGKLLALDAASGERRYAVDLAESFDDGGKTIPRSVWAVEPIESGPGDLLVTTEDGYVKAVAADDGSVVWETHVHEPDADDLESYYRRLDNRPTMAGRPGRPADANFFNLDVTILDDTAPGYVISIHELRSEGQENPGQLAFVTPDGDVRWRNETIDLGESGNVLGDPRSGSDAILVFTSPEQATQPITALSLSDGRELEVVEVPAVPTAADQFGVEDVGYLGSHDGALIVGSESGDLLAIDDSGDVTWSFPAIRDSATLEADFTGDGTDDVLVYSRNRLDRRRGVESRSLVLRSGTDGAIVWSRTVPTGQFHDEGGLVSLCPRQRTDGSVDPLGIEQRPRGEHDERISELEREIDRLEREARRQDVDNSAAIDDRLEEIESLGGRRIADLVVLAGEDGSEQRRIELTVETEGVLDDRIEPISVDVFGDDDRVAVVGGRQSISLVDLDTGELFWRRRYREEGMWPPLDSRAIQYHTIKGAGEVDDLVAVAPDEPAVALVETGLQDGDLYFEPTTTVELDGDGIVRGSVETLADLDGDGHQELLCQVRDGDGLTAVVVSPGAGETLERFTGSRHPQPTVEETTNPAGDGPGLVTFTSVGDRFTVTVTDDIEERWRRQQSLERGSRTGRNHRPAALAGDVDGDGREEIAIATSSSEGGAKIDLYNVARDERVERIVLEEFDETVDPDADPLVPAFRVERLPDQTGDGNPELGVVLDTRTEAPSRPRGESDVRFYVVDPAEGAVLVSGPADGGGFVALRDGIGQLGRDGSLRTVDPTTGVSLENVGGATPVELSWRFDDDRDHVTTVSIDGQPVAITTERSTEVRLPAGTHAVDIEATSPRGFTVSDSATVTVDADSSMDVLLYGAAGVSVLGLLGTPLLEGIRRVRS